MVEPLEETRSELTFATEPLLSSLSQSIPSASRSPLVDLDEVEVRTRERTTLAPNTTLPRRFRKASYNFAKVSIFCTRQHASFTRTFRPVMFSSILMYFILESWLFAYASHNLF